MPIYEYQCEDCGYIFEELTVGMNTSKISTYCPICKEQDKESVAKKIISNGTVFNVRGYNQTNGYSGNMR